jgi:N-acetyl-anhydromuramyl-L-alanine amidase AmpD
MAPILRPAHPNGCGPRQGFVVDTIVVHTTEGTAGSALAWFADPAAHVAAHYVIDPDGTVYACVQEDAAAWHAGNYGVNLASVGIECAGYCGRIETWTAPLLASLVDLIVEVCRRHPRVVPDRTHIIGHAEVPDPSRPGHFGGKGGHTDPGVLINWNFIMGEVRRRLAPLEVA